MDVGIIVLVRAKICKCRGRKVILLKAVTHNKVDREHDAEAHESEKHLVSNQAALKGQIFISTLCGSVDQKVRIEDEPLLQRIEPASSGGRGLLVLVGATNRCWSLASSKRLFELVPEQNVDLGPDDDRNCQNDGSEFGIPDESVENGVVGTIRTDLVVLGGGQKLLLDVAAHFQFFFLRSTDVTEIASAQVGGHRRFPGISSFGKKIELQI